MCSHDAIKDVSLFILTTCTPVKVNKDEFVSMEISQMISFVIYSCVQTVSFKEDSGTFDSKMMEH